MEIWDIADGKNEEGCKPDSEVHEGRANGNLVKEHMRSDVAKPCEYRIVDRTEVWVLAYP